MMEELSITLAILLCAWVYMLMHPYYEKARQQWPAWVIANILFFGALVTGVLGAL